MYSSRSVSGLDGQAPAWRSQPGIPCPTPTANRPGCNSARVAISMAAKATLRAAAGMIPMPTRSDPVEARIVAAWLNAPCKKQSSATHTSGKPSSSAFRTKPTSSPAGMCAGTWTPVTGPAGTGPRIVCLRFRLRKLLDDRTGLVRACPQLRAPDRGTRRWPGSEVCRDGLEQVVVVIDEVHDAPLVERGARVRRAQRNQVADFGAVAGRDGHVRVLVADRGHLPAGLAQRTALGRAAADVGEGDGVPGVLAEVPPPGRQDDQPRFGRRQHLRPHLQRRLEIRAGRSCPP